MCNILYGCYTNGRSHIGSRLEIICRMPVQMEAKSRVLSVTDIQGKWSNKSSRSVWKVTGIVVEKAGVPKQQKQPVVLSDGPTGVVWGNGNFTGNLENGWLVWRNRRGEASYRWKKLEGSKEEMREELKAADEAKAAQTRAIPKVKQAPAIPKVSGLWN